MSSGKVAGWAHGEEFVDESTLFPDDGVLARARERGSELKVSLPQLEAELGCGHPADVESRGDPVVVGDAEHERVRRVDVDVAAEEDLRLEKKK